jgi:hypothetical protein
MRNPNVSDLQNQNYHHAPPRSTSLQNQIDSRAPHNPTVSSVYSRPSNDLSYYHNNSAATSAYEYEDISPPSSPELNTSLPRRYRSMRDVSPVDDNRGQSASNVPVLRKAPPVIQTGEVNPPNKFWGIKLAPNSKVKWDEYSGEPTSSKAGRAGQVNPGTYAKETVRPRPQLGYQVSVSGPESKKKAASIAARFAMRSTPTENVTAPAENVTAHEPWGQPTGRSQITPPLRDEATRNPLQFPKTSGSRALEVLDWDSSNALAISVNHGQTTADTRHVPNDLRYLDSRIRRLSGSDQVRLTDQ